MLFDVLILDLICLFVSRFFGPSACATVLVLEIFWTLGFISRHR